MENKKKEQTPRPNLLRGGFFWILIFLGIIYITNLFNAGMGGLVKKLNYAEFYSKVENNLVKPEIKSVKKTENTIQGEYTEAAGGGKFYVYVPEEDKDLIAILRKNVKNFEVEPPRTFITQLIFSLIPMALFIAFLWYFSYKGSQFGSRVWSFGRSRAQIIEKEKATRITFKDVAGIDEAKEELTEVIEYLKDPKRFQRLGGRIPKGVILVGPPGCGKTLLAKAVAGEAEVPFFSISGSDFVEMFVGVGASRVRDLFDQAKKAAKLQGRGCIIFIDEIDAVGRQRFAGIGGGHDEREQTLNQLLAEMDGFQTEEGIIIMAATNRPDVLDSALLRPGRFDRHVIVSLPDIKGREEVLKVHTRKVKLAANIDLKSIASQTPGFSGADLANLCNEAALLAARHNKESVEQADFEKSIERLMIGPEKKSHIMSMKDKEITALHEAGHALISLLLPELDPPKRISIIPRGLAGGYTFAPPIEDKHHWFKNEILARIVFALGGRASEEINLHDITTGAQDDLEKATQMARHMVTKFGMSEKLGNVTLGRREGPVFLGRDLLEEKNYSEETARIIDEEVKKVIDESYAKAKTYISQNIDKLKALSDALLVKEVLDGEEAKKITGLRPKTDSGREEPSV
ncbi:MAG: ATP-dependent zinc metalloprotease FtsH [Candidatus Omnitrophota bacterium]